VEDRGPAAYIAEFVGTLMLVFAIGMVLSLDQPRPLGLGYTDFAVVGLVHVFVLALIVASIGGTSGAHVNPAVTACLAALRKIKPIDAAIYVLLQLAGAVAGALLVRALIHDAGQGSHYGATSFANQFLGGSTGKAFLAELIGTFLLMWAIMAAAVNPRAERSWAPWIIGGTLGFAVMIIGPLTGAGFNPARAFGPALVGDAWGGGGKWIVVYALAPVVGALLAGTSYTAIVLRDQEALFGGRLIDADVPPGRVAGEVEAAEHGPGERPIDKLS
jgi:MIP family channel proteins